MDLARVVWTEAKKRGANFADVLVVCEILIRSMAANSGEPMETIVRALKKRLLPRSDAARVRPHADLPLAAGTGDPQSRPLPARAGKVMESGCRQPKQSAAPTGETGRAEVPAGSSEPVGIPLQTHGTPNDARSLPPLFIALRAEYFDAFVDGSKVYEYRMRGSRWNADTCRIGRRVVLSRGYGKGHRISGTITGFHYDATPSTLPGWLECYGSSAGDASCIRIEVDRPTAHERIDRGPEHE